MPSCSTRFPLLDRYTVFTRGPILFVNISYSTRLLAASIDAVGAGTAEAALDDPASTKKRITVLALIAAGLRVHLLACGMTDDGGFRGLIYVAKAAADIGHEVRWALNGYLP